MSLNVLVSLYNMCMSVSRQNQEKLQLQQQQQANGGLLLKNIFGIYASHPWLSILFVIVFAIFTNSLFEVMSSIFGESSFPFFTLVILTLIQLLLLILIFLIIWRLHYGSIKPRPIHEKRILVTLVSSNKDKIEDTTSYAVLDAVLYNASGVANRNLLEEVVLVATEDQTSQALAKELCSYIEAGEKKATIKTISVNERYPADIKKQLQLVINEIMQQYNAGDILTDYTGGTKNMSIALHSLSLDNFISTVYLYDAMDKKNKYIR